VKRHEKLNLGVVGTINRANASLNGVRNLNIVATTWWQ